MNMTQAITCALVGCPIESLEYPCIYIQINLIALTSKSHRLRMLLRLLIFPERKKREKVIQLKQSTSSKNEEGTTNTCCICCACGDIFC